MDWVLLQIKDTSFLLHAPPLPPPSAPQSNGFNLNNSINPSILLIIVIIAIIFFISGLLHLLLRFLPRPQIRIPDETDGFTALQGQLQQLFHLHDAGVDQSFIDTLPLFNYSAIIGPKNPFDCAVCLSEFEPEDKLRLLPKCSHAFHMNCIDTWLLSHSTCPICRAILVPDFSHSHSTSFSPVVMVLESGNVSFRDDVSEKSGEIEASEREIVSVKLGKYRSVVDGGDDDGGSGESSVAAARRCFSMGSFAYLMDDDLSLKVPVRTAPTTKRKPCLPPLGSNLRTTMSECGCDSLREFNGVDAFRILEVQSGGDDNKFITRNKRDSFSVSKIWLRGKKDKANAVLMESSRRAFSSRFPMQRNPMDFDEGIERCDSLDSEGNPPSFGRRTLHWLIGRQDNKAVLQSSITSNV